MLLPRKAANRYRSEILELRNRLESVYISDLSEEDILERKRELIDGINNAYIDLFSTYETDLDLFYAVLDTRDGDLPRTINTIVRLAGTSPADPKAPLKELLLPE